MFIILISLLSFKGRVINTSFDLKDNQVIKGHVIYQSPAANELFKSKDKQFKH